MNKLQIISITAVAALAAGCGAAGEDGGQSYAATLAASPNVETGGTGTGEFSYDPETMEFSWIVEYEGLSGPAVAAHIHGPADPGANAGVAVPFANAATPITGTATLSEEQAAELAAGRYYVNIHTAANPGGEIRGQIEAE
jgi:hypothetical protein